MQARNFPFPPLYLPGKWMLSALLSFFVLQGTGQKKVLQQADLLFSEGKYSQAIPLYTKVYEKKNDRTLLLKIADCHFKNENYVQAQKNYAIYFNDTVYEAIPQFADYSTASRLLGKLDLARRLYRIIYDTLQDESARSYFERYQHYFDYKDSVQVYDLDAEYNCVTLDASASFDSQAAPLFYLWDFGGGNIKEGMRIEHCFERSGEHQIVLNIKDAATGYVRMNDTTLTVFIDSPLVYFSAPETGKKYFDQEFKATAPELPEEEILEYIWDMDNGDMLVGKEVKYKFMQIRDYKVKLTLLTKNKSTGRYALYASSKSIDIADSYDTPDKKFIETRDGSK
jgi:hypothetical protein